MKHPFKYLGLLSLPALAALLYFPTGKIDFIGFLGFLAFFRYFWVNPDELFLHTLRRHAVDAAQVAQIRHRKAEIIYISSVTVTHPPTSFRSAAEGRGV